MRRRKTRRVQVTFDCGAAGKVTWELPPQLVREGVADEVIAHRAQAAWGDSVRIFFGLIFAMTSLGRDVLSVGMLRLDARLKEIAREILSRS